MKINDEITRMILRGQIDFLQNKYWEFIKSERGEFKSAVDYRNFMVYELEKSIISLNKKQHV